MEQWSWSFLRDPLRVAAATERVTLIVIHVVSFLYRSWSRQREGWVEDVKSRTSPLHAPLSSIGPCVMRAPMGPSWMERCAHPPRRSETASHPSFCRIQPSLSARVHTPGISFDNNNDVHGDAEIPEGLWGNKSPCNSPQGRFTVEKLCSATSVWSHEWIFSKSGGTCLGSDASIK